MHKLKVSNETNKGDSKPTFIFSLFEIPVEVHLQSSGGWRIYPTTPWPELFPLQWVTSTHSSSLRSLLPTLSFLPLCPVLHSPPLFCTPTLKPFPHFTGSRWTYFKYLLRSDHMSNFYIKMRTKLNAPFTFHHYYYVYKHSNNNNNNNNFL